MEEIFFPAIFPRIIASVPAMKVNNAAYSGRTSVRPALSPVAAESREPAAASAAATTAVLAAPRDAPTSGRRRWRSRPAPARTPPARHQRRRAPPHARYAATPSRSRSRARYARPAESSSDAPPPKPANMATIRPTCPAAAGAASKE